jgi:hypothetical protein
VSQIDPAGNKTITSLLRSIGKYFSLSGYDIPFNPCPGDIGVKGDFVFQLTGLYTETATDAFISINEKYKAPVRCSGMNNGRPENSVQSLDQHNSGGSFYGQFYKISPVHMYLLMGFGCLMRIMAESAF